MLSPTGALAALLLLLSTALPSLCETYTLLHRLEPGTSWQPRARIHFAEPFEGEMALPSPRAPQTEDLLGEDGLKGLFEQKKGADLGFYQLMLAKGDVQGPESETAQAPITFIKECQLLSDPSRPAPATLQDVLTLHVLRPTLEGASSSAAASPLLKPYALDYHIQNNALGAAGCPVWMNDSTDLAQTSPKLNTTLRLRTPTSPFTPPLRAPPPIAEDGTVKEPPPEKSFIQKYWMYMVPALILLMMPAEQSEDGGAEGDESSNAPRSGGRAVRKR